MEDPNEMQVFLPDVNEDPVKLKPLANNRSKAPKSRCSSFINIKVFVLLAGLANIPVYSATFYLSSQLTSIEKHFGISSSKSAAMISANEIGFLLSVIPFSYVLKDSHKPRILALSNIGGAIACLLCSLPYFFLPVPGNTHSWNATQGGSLKQLDHCMSNNDLNNDCNTKKETNAVIAAYVLMFIGMILGGICKSIRYPLVACYIDDNINKVYIGGYMSVMGALHVLGFVAAFILGGYFSQIYVTLSDTSLTLVDPAWIGAWWLGFLSFSLFSLLISIPLFAFPRSFVEIEEGKPKKRKLSLKDIAQTILRLIRNHSIVLITVFTVLCIFNVSGKTAFLPKYYETQFGWPAWKANVVIGLTYVSMFVFGIVISGIVSNYFQLTIAGGYRINVLVLFLHIFIAWAAYNITCRKSVIAETYLHNSTLAVSTGDQALQSYCLGCECPKDDYSLICGEDGLNYRSPCYAGCQLFNSTSYQYSNCSCIGGKSTAYYGSCPKNCKAGIYLTILNAIHSFLIGLTTSPNTIILLRSVLESDRTMTISLSTFFNSVFGFFPAPPLFGLIVDHTCKIWSSLPCGGKGYCKSYDIEKFRVRFFSLLGILDLLGFFSILLAAVLSHRSRMKAKKSISRTNFD